MTVLAIPVHSFRPFPCPGCRNAETHLKVRNNGAVLPRTKCCSCGAEFELVCPEDPGQTMTLRDREELCEAEERRLREIFHRDNPGVLAWEFDRWKVPKLPARVPDVAPPRRPREVEHPDAG